MLQHFRDSRLVATYCVGFCVLFTLSTIFTFVGFHLAAPPYGLSTAAIGSLFISYLAGVVTTSLVGRGVATLGRLRMVQFALIGWGVGIALTLLPSIVAVIAGLVAAAAFCFVCQAASTSYVALTAQRGRSSAVGLYVTFVLSRRQRRRPGRRPRLDARRLDRLCRLRARRARRRRAGRAPLLGRHKENSQ